MRNAASGVLLIAAVTAMLLTLIVLVATPRLPECPHEDSCEIDYRSGQWFIDGQAVSR